MQARNILTNLSPSPAI